MLAENADEDGLLNKAAFVDAVRKFVAAHGDIAKKDRKRLKQVLKALFKVFDADGNGVVDFTELSSGLSVLCGGNHDDKAASAFALYDFNGDGFIDESEMTSYLTSVFKVLFTVEPGAQDSVNGMSAEELARVTTE